MPEELDKDAVKQAVKEAAKEWMDEKYKEVGRWTMNTFLVAIIGALVWLILISKGLNHK